MNRVDTIVVGAGHAGLAVSSLLSAAGREHMVLERGRVGERWRSERWDSLHLLTPNWMTRLPGWDYRWPSPDGYQSAGAFARLLGGYAASFGAPVLERTRVEDVVSTRSADAFLIRTDRGHWRASNLVVATGPHGKSRTPQAIQGAYLPSLEVISARRYRNPQQLPPGGVLVVGASSSGVQIADELARAGRRVVLAVGRHTRMPRRYRGRDIFWWLERTGRLARTIDEVRDRTAARSEPSLPLAGRNEPELFGRNLDLATLQAIGVQLVGRLERVAGERASFGDDLAETVAAAHEAMGRFLDVVDDYISRTGIGRELPEPDRPRAVRLPRPQSSLDLRAEEISTIVLATGFRAHHPWLRFPVVMPDGTIEQYRGVTAVPGLYVVGQRFQHRRDSGFIHGARFDADAVVGHLIGKSAGNGRAA